MAVCSECAQEMSTAASCRDWELRPRGHRWAQVRYGEERTFFDDPDNFFGYDEVEPDDWDYYEQIRRGRREPIPLPVPERSGDCGVRPGGLHHHGCDLARCPCCDGQLISCGDWDGKIQHQVGRRELS